MIVYKNIACLKCFLKLDICFHIYDVDLFLER